MREKVKGKTAKWFKRWIRERKLMMEKTKKEKGARARR